MTLDWSVKKCTGYIYIFFYIVIVEGVGSWGIKMKRKVLGAELKVGKS